MSGSFIRYLLVPMIAFLLTFEIYRFIDKMISGDDEIEQGQSSGKALIGAPFTLTNQDGEKISSESFKGKFLLVYFGFTNCPMVCPTDMANLTQFLDFLGKEKADKIQPVFITIDPERDTPEQIKQFLASFYPSFQGFSGTSEEIADVANSYRVYSKKVTSEELSEYTMNHSAYTYFMSRDGEYITHLRHEQPINEMADSINRYLLD